jgi:hypothetical protein
VRLREVVHEEEEVEEEPRKMVSDAFGTRCSWLGRGAKHGDPDTTRSFSLLVLRDSLDLGTVTTAVLTVVLSRCGSTGDVVNLGLWKRRALGAKHMVSVERFVQKWNGFL